MVRAIAMFVYIKASFPSALIGQNNGKARWSLEAEFEFLRRRCKFSLFSSLLPPPSSACLQASFQSEAEFGHYICSTRVGE